MGSPGLSKSNPSTLPVFLCWCSHCWCPALILCIMLVPSSPAIASVAVHGSNSYLSLENYSWSMEPPYWEISGRLYFPSGHNAASDCLIEGCKNWAPLLQKGTALWYQSHSRTPYGIRLKLDFNWNLIFVEPLPLIYPASLALLEVSPECTTSVCLALKNPCLSLCFWEPNFRQWWTFDIFWLPSIPSPFLIAPEFLFGNYLPATLLWTVLIWQ